MKRWKRWPKRLAIYLGILSTILVAGPIYLFHLVNSADLRHAAFQECGTSISTFLSNYAKAIQIAKVGGDISALNAFYAHDYSSPQRGQWQFDSAIDLGGVTLANLVSTGRNSDGTDAVLAELQQYLSGIVRVDFIKYKISLIEKIEPGVSAVLTVKYILDGEDRVGQLFQDRFFFRWHIENRKRPSQADNWQIVRDELVEGVRVAGRGNSFERMDLATLGIDYAHQRDPKLNPLDPEVRLKFAVIQHAAGGVSAVDYDGDGRTDLFFPDGVRSRLYRNVTQSGSRWPAFDDVTIQSGIGVIDRACSAMFGDFDNDGDKDLFVARYTAPCRFFYNDGNGRFLDATSKVGLKLVAPCISSCLLDYDSDGFLDIYIGVNGDAVHDSPDIPFYAVNGQPNRLFRNASGRRFIDVTEKTGTGDHGWTLAVTSGDYDNDGWPDLAVANDFGRKVLYRNNGDGTFTDRAKESGVLDFSGGMGLAFADLNGDDFCDLLTSNIESGQRYFGEEITLWQFMRNEVRSGWIWSDLPKYVELYNLLGEQWRELGKQVGEGNSAFCNQRDGTFVEWKDCHAARAGWAWSVNPFDFDNDGDLDIYVANGWITGKKKDDL
jgi:hypothetical protein